MMRPLVLRPVASLCAAGLFLSGCISLAPDYERPTAPIPKQLPSDGAEQPRSEETHIPPVNNFVRDARLRAVIVLALANSRSMRATVAAVEAARAVYGGRKAALFPTVEAALDATYARNLNFFSGGTYNLSQYRAGLGLAAFELDLFGRNRNLAEAELEAYMASQQALHAARITLVAETAQAWLTLAMDEALLELATRTVESAQRTVDVVSQRQGKGVSSQLEVNQASLTLHQASADVARLKTTVAQDKNALRLLVGRDVDPRLLPGALPEDADYFAEVPAGLSSKILLTRPDVLQAEHTLRAQYANIGAARAAFFPTLSLTGTGGLASRSLAGLFNGDSAFVYSVSPGLSVPIFDGGANSSNLALAKANRRQALANYQLAIQTAFREVADALSRRATLQEELAAQQALSETATQAFEIAEKRYRGGIENYLSTLDAQRTAYSAEQALIQSRVTALANRITTYRVLGGGTMLSELEGPPAPPRPDTLP